MKNKLKIMMMVVLSMFIVTGCATTSPTEVVNNYFEEIKKGENAEVTEYLLESLESTDAGTESDDETEVEIIMFSMDKTLLGKSDDTDSLVEVFR